MKTFIAALLIFIVSLFAVPAGAQTTDGHRQLVVSETSITLSPIVAAYAVGDRVANQTANKILFATTIPIAANPTAAGEICNIRLDMDSTSIGYFRFYALKDTAGIGAALANDNAAFVFTPAVRTNLIGQGTLTLRTEGTGGVAYADTAYIHTFLLPAGHTKIYWIVVAATAYTAKQNGVMKLTVTTEAR